MSRSNKSLVAIAGSTAIDPTIWLERYGDYLYRHALFRVRNAAAAEDVVQETLVAAWRSSSRFAGRSSERTWLVGILKHKIIDHFRKSSVETNFESDSVEEDCFDRNGSWRSSAWDPEFRLEEKDFYRMLERCLDQLPERLRSVFTLREIEGLSSEEICKLLDITPQNLWVMLHRARLRLQQLLGSC